MGSHACGAPGDKGVIELVEAIFFRRAAPLRRPERMSPAVYDHASEIQWGQLLRDTPEELHEISIS